MPDLLPVFYEDLNDPTLMSHIAVFHQRFSTNTLPQWRLAQPFRYLAHNGEINTICGNRNWANARASKFHSELLPELRELLPLVSMAGSDSMSLDNMLEVLLAGGMDIFRAMRLLLPPAWQNMNATDPEMRAWLEYASMHMEPWDGPAGVVLTNGRYAACALDRNGLRPARYVITRDRQLTLASEIGVYDYDPEDVVVKGRVKPGQMFAVDTDTGDILQPEKIDEQLKTSRPFARWLQTHSRHLRSRLRDTSPTTPSMDDSQLIIYEKMFGVTFEERDQILRVLAEDAQEAIGSMGDDTPFPVLSQNVRSLYENFRQQFAQVTNPPIDPLRESIVMSLETCIGVEQNLFKETVHITAEAVEAIRNEAVIIVLSDRNLEEKLLPVHALLATGAVHHSLIEAGLRCDANIVVETGTARDPHHMAVLVGYGATCIYPYLSYETIQGMVRRGDIEGKDALTFVQNYRKGINKGLLKVLSKMGISTVASYRGAQLFEIVGLHKEVVDQCFVGTTSRIQGADFTDLTNDMQVLCDEAWNKRATTRHGGLLKYVEGGEYHAYNPDVVQTLQEAVTSGEYSDYEKYASIVDQRQPTAVRDLLKLKTAATPLPLEEVESVSDIISRFDSAGMSLGALSPEAHETLAEAMNVLGARSNSGEGGEDPERYGTVKNSKIKQVASGRFGVTPHYLVNAEVIQIKIAQGAKPGEGGSRSRCRYDCSGCSQSLCRSHYHFRL